MNGNTHAAVTRPQQLWVYQKAAPMPDWVKGAIVEEPMPNGTFTIKSKLGSARVHPGGVVFEFAGHLYSCAHGEMKQVVEELISQHAEVPPVMPAVRPAADRKAGKPAVVTRTIARSDGVRKWAPAKGMPPSIENRHPDELNLDDSYQRSTDNGASRALIARIANGWDWRMCLPLVVSKRDDGSLWVIDGQHRLAAAKMRGDIPFLPCCVAVYGSVAAEAEMFVAMNRSRKAMNRLDDFHAALASGDSEAIEIAGLITGAGFRVSRKTGSQSWVPGEVAFTTAIAKVLRKHGPKVCADALTTIAEAFPDEVLNAGASMFTALTKLAINPPPHFDSGRLFRALLRRNQREWASFLNEVKGGGDERALQLRQVLLMAYDEEPATLPEQGIGGDR